MEPDCLGISPLRLASGAQFCQCVLTLIPGIDTVFTPQNTPTTLRHNDWRPHGGNVANFALQGILKQTSQTQGDRCVLCKFKDTVYLLVEECKIISQITQSISAVTSLILIIDGWCTPPRFLTARGQKILLWHSKKLPGVDFPEFQPYSD